MKRHRVTLNSKDLAPKNLYI